MQNPVFTDEVTLTGDGTRQHPLRGAPGFGVPAPPDKSVQINNGGAFGGSADFTYDPATGQLNFFPVTPGSFANISTMGAGSYIVVAGGKSGNSGLDINLDYPEGVLLQCDESPSGGVHIWNVPIPFDNSGQIELVHGDDTPTVHQSITIDGTGVKIADRGATPKLGFFGTAPVIKPTVTGAKLPGDAVMASLLAALAALGLITDTTT
jgi:hypothetical protein